MAVRAVVRHDIGSIGGAIETPPTEPFQWRGVGPVAFTALEEQVIQLALADGLGSIEPPGFIERMFKTIFGLQADGHALADPRLETLRRAVVVAHHRHHLPDGLAAALRHEGYAPIQIRMIEARAVAG